MHETPVVETESDAHSPALPSSEAEHETVATSRNYASTRYLIPALILLTIAAFANSLSGGFIYDDRPQIVNNPVLGHWDGATLKRVFTRDIWAVMKPDLEGESISSVYYRPVFVLFLMAAHAVVGVSPTSWHLLVLFIHILAVIGVFFVFEKSISMATGAKDERGRLMAVFAAAVFAVHPVQGEAVSWVSGVVAPLNAVFLLASFYCYLTYRQRAKNVLLLAALVLFVFAALTKETALILPFIIAAYEVWVLPRETRLGARELAMRVVPFVIVVIAYMAMRYNALHILFGRHPNLNFPEDASLTLMDNLRTLPVLILMYVKLLLFPVNLSLIYDLGYVRSLGLLSFWVPLAIVAVMVVLCVRLWRIREARVALIWLVLPMLIVLNTRAFVSEEIVHDRYLYLSVPGLGLLVAILLTRVRQIAGFRFTDRQLAGVAVAVAVLLCVLTAVQNRRWQNEDVFWAETLTHAPRSRVVHIKLGERAEEKQDFEGALREYNAALSVHPDIVDALNNAAFMNSRLGRWQDATLNFERIVELTPNKAIAHYNLAIAYGRQKRFPEVVRELRTAIELDPDGPRAGEWKQGLDQLEKALTAKGLATPKTS